MADSDFKNNKYVLLDGWVVNSTGEVIGEDKYRPDISIRNNDGDVTCVMESTSTNDRKVGLGEMLLAEKFFIDNKNTGVLVFSLCGKSTSPPRPDTQYEYIKPYFELLKSQNKECGIKEIYFIYEEEFEQVNWNLLSEDFNEKALKLFV